MSSGLDANVIVTPATADGAETPRGGGVTSPGTAFLHRSKTIFDNIQLGHIVELCFGSDHVPDMSDWMEQLDDLLGIKLGAVRPTDLTVLETDTIISHLDPAVHTKYASPVRTIRLRVSIIDYYLTRVTPNLTATMTYETLSTMVKAVDASKLRDTTLPAEVSPPKKSSDTDGTLFEKLDLPKLSKFNGDRSEWFKWSESVRVAFGSVGVSGSLTDQNFYTKYPQVSERVFYVIYAALQSGTCGGLARQFEMASDLNVFKLWSRITQEYETDTNKLNQSL